MASQPGSELPPLGRRGEGWVAGQVVLAVLIVTSEILGPPWPETMAGVLTAIGAGIAALGLALAFAGGFSLGRLLTPFPKPVSASALREGGAYGFVRHPMYGGVLLAVFGWSIASTPLGLAATALLAVFLELKSRREEAWLLERHPQYEAYRRSVRWKFFPGVR